MFGSPFGYQAPHDHIGAWDQKHYPFIEPPFTTNSNDPVYLGENYLISNPTPLEIPSSLPSTTGNDASPQKVEEEKRPQRRAPIQKPVKRDQFGTLKSRGKKQTVPVIVNDRGRTMGYMAQRKMAFRHFCRIAKEHIKGLLAEHPEDVPLDDDLKEIKSILAAIE